MQGEKRKKTERTLLPPGTLLKPLKITTVSKPKVKKEIDEKILKKTSFGPKKEGLRKNKHSCLSFSALSFTGC